MMEKLIISSVCYQTESALSGEKTMMRRFEEVPLHFRENDPYYQRLALSKAKFKNNKTVAIGQSYEEVFNELNGKDPEKAERWMEMLTFVLRCDPRKVKGWKDKMNARAEFMIHHALITDVRVERLCNISEEDCFREGVFKTDKGFTMKGLGLFFDTPQLAYAEFLYKVHKKRLWNYNPYAFVYSFKVTD